MKKTLAAVAVLGAFAGSALAADVQLYGIVDTGLLYSHVDADRANIDATDSFQMKSGMASGSRFGLKGTEDLGNGLTVGFVLENGFDSDTGADSGVFFDRESSLFLEGGFGKVAFGQMGSLNSGKSSWAKYGMISAFGTSFTDYSAQAGSFAVGAGSWDNMISYATPTFAGVTVYAQYGMGNKVTSLLPTDETKLVGDENESTSKRYYSLGATYANGPLNLYAAVDSINYASAGDGGKPDVDDSLTVTLGGNFDFEVVKLFAGAQYFDEIETKNLKGLIGTDGVLAGKFASKMEGWGIGVSALIPAGPGAVLVGAGYMDAQAADSDSADFDSDEMQRWVVSAGYDYVLSKRTDIYVAATYMQDNISYTHPAVADQDASVFGAMVGLRHKF